MENLNELVAAAQAILDNGFNPSAFMSWEFLAFLTLAALLGPLHYYTQNFKRLTSGKTPQSLLAGRGLIEAAKAELLRSDKPDTLADKFLSREIQVILNKPKYSERLSDLVTMGSGSKPSAFYPSPE
jgi:hypothetical protein